MDIKAALQEADQTFAELLQVLSAIEEDRINVVPFAGSWTAGQVVQHIILSADGFVQLLNGPVKDTDRDPEANITTLRDTFLNFNIKMTSPEFVLPEEKHYDKQSLIEAVRGIKTGLLKGIETLDTSKTCLAFELPVMGHVTRAEGITFAIVHTRRHVHQLKNIIRHLTMAIA